MKGEDFPLNIRQITTKATFPKEDFKNMSVLVLLMTIVQICAVCDMNGKVILYYYGVEEYLEGRVI